MGVSGVAHKPADSFALAGDMIAAGENRIVERDGYGWRYRLEPDEYSSINGFDCYGKVAPVENRYGCQQKRPDGFDGFARIVDGWRGDRFWWQPPAEWKNDPEEVSSLARLVSNILAYGFSMVIVERVRLGDVDGYGNPIVDGVASAYGVEPFSEDVDVRFIVSEIIDDLAVPE